MDRFWQIMYQYCIVGAVAARCGWAVICLALPQTSVLFSNPYETLNWTRK